MSLHSKLQTAHVLAKDGLCIAGWAADMMLNLIPAQAIRVARGRDYNAAVDRAAAPVDVEEFDQLIGTMEVHPSEVVTPDLIERTLGQYPSWRDLLDPETLNGQLPQEKAPAGVTADSGTAPVGHPDSAASATADSPAGAEIPPDQPPAPAGHPPAELVELIVEVLAEHHPVKIAEDHLVCSDGALGCGAGPWTSRGQWRAHVALLIATRIEKAAPPADFARYDYCAGIAYAIGVLEGKADWVDARPLLEDPTRTYVKSVIAEVVAQLQSAFDSLMPPQSPDPNP